MPTHQVIRINNAGDIYRRAKAAAALEGITLGEYIDRALAAAVDNSHRSQDNSPSK